MVLRRPYAFLIRYFKLIHLIITAILFYFAFRCTQIYKYLLDVIKGVGSRYDAVNYINYGMFLSIVIVLFLCFAIYWLFKYKNKPRKIYVATIIGYIIVLAFMLTLFGYLGGFSSNVIDQKTIRLYRDLLTIVLSFQYYIIIVMFIRGLGFDIKKFDFKKDAQELNLNEADSEEVEVNVGVDTTNVVRGIRKRQREFGYFFKEYKWYILTIIFVLLGIFGYKGYNYFNTKYKVYYENQLIGSTYGIVIRDSYYNIDNGKGYVVINFDVRKEGVREQLNTGNILLGIGKKKYSPDKNICYRFSKLGTCYKKQNITNDFYSYILSYEVDELNIQDAYIFYNEGYEDVYKVKLAMKEY